MIIIFIITDNNVQAFNLSKWTRPRHHCQIDQIHFDKNGRVSLGTCYKLKVQWIYFHQHQNSQSKKNRTRNSKPGDSIRHSQQFGVVQIIIELHWKCNTDQTEVNAMINNYTFCVSQREKQTRSMSNDEKLTLPWRCIDDG